MLVAAVDPADVKQGYPTTCPILSMFDINGDLTKEPDDAFTAIILLPDNDHMVISCQRRNIVEMRVN